MRMDVDSYLVASGSSKLRVSWELCREASDHAFLDPRDVLLLFRPDEHVDPRPQFQDSFAGLDVCFH